jgi:hypothetical protein
VSALLIALAMPAAAGQPEAPRVTVSGGAGVAMPFHGDFDFTAAAWQAAVRVTVNPHMLIEGFYGEWRHSTERVLPDQRVTGPGGLIGSIDRVTVHTKHVRPEVGFNVLLAATAGRVMFSAGGGAGLLVYRRQFTQTYEGCQVTTGSCTDVSTRFTSGSFSVQGVAGLDVAIVPRLRAFGEYRIGVPVEDVGFGQSTVLGGLRVTLW